MCEGSNFTSHRNAMAAIAEARSQLAGARVQVGNDHPAYGLLVHMSGVDVGRFYVLPSYALDGSQGVQLREIRADHTTYGWLMPAADVASTEVWRTLDAGPWVTAGRGTVFEVAEQLGYARLDVWK